MTGSQKHRDPRFPPYVFTEQGVAMRLRTIQRLVKEVASLAKISRLVTPYVLRHTLSATAIPKDISLLALRRLLGRDRLTTTEIYLDLSPEEVIREFQAK